MYSEALVDVDEEFLLSVAMAEERGQFANAEEGTVRP
jgi:hypothetical protein